MQRILESFIMLALISVLLIGCGGGTTGSGDSTTQISGQVKNAAGNPIKDAEIEVVETGESTKTDQDGQFELQVMSGINELTLAVSAKDSSGNVSGSVLIADLPTQRAEVQVQITVDSNSGSVVIDSVNIEIEESLPANTSLDQTAANDPINQQNNEKPASNQNQSIQEQKPQKSVLLLSTYKPNGAPLEGVLINVLSGTGSGWSNSAGKARINTEPSKDGTLSLSVSFAGLSARINFKGLPIDKPVRVIADLVINIDKSSTLPDVEGSERITVSGEIIAINSNRDNSIKPSKPNSQNSQDKKPINSNKLTTSSNGIFETQAAQYEDF